MLGNLFQKVWPTTQSFCVVGLLLLFWLVDQSDHPVQQSEELYGQESIRNNFLKRIPQ